MRDCLWEIPGIYVQTDHRRFLDDTQTVCDMKYETANVSETLNTSVPKPFLIAPREIANCVVALTKTLVIDCEAGSMKQLSSATSSRAPAAGTIPPSIAGHSSKRSPQSFDTFQVFF